MEMKPYGRKTRNHGRSAAQYAHPQGPSYYTPMDFTAAATSASAIYTTAPYPPPTAAAYYPPPPQPQYFAYPADKSTVERMVRKQIEYYLSEENLIKDVFLRNKMDKDGFVLLSEIASFQRVASLTQDMETVVSALKESETIEICDGIKIRPKKDPLRWPFPTNLQLQYLPQPQAPIINMLPVVAQQPQPQPIKQQLQPPLINRSQTEHATNLPTQPQLLQHLTPAATATPLQDHQEPELSSPQQINQTNKQPQPGPTQSDASSPNNSNSSDISTNNRSSLTYATAVTTNIITPTNGHNHHQPQQKQSQSQQQKQDQSQAQKQNQSQQQPIGDIPNNKHNKSSTPVESEWKEVKSRRRRPGKA